MRSASGGWHQYRADDVISAADGHTTLYALLDGKYLDEEIQRYYDDLPRFQPLIQVSLGVARDLSQEPHAVIYALKQSVTIEGKALTRMGYRHYGFDPTMAPAGKSVVIVSFPSDYTYWRQRSSDQALYAGEKEQVAHSVIAALEQRFPGITEQIEVTDVVTPLTYEQYTGNWEGCPEGWLLTTTTMGMLMGKGMRKTLPGLAHLYMAGHWVEPGGGVPTVAASGRNAIQLICHRDHQKFMTSVPEAVSAR